MTDNPEGAPQAHLAPTPAPNSSRISERLIQRHREVAARAKAMKRERTAKLSTARSRALRAKRKAASATPVTQPPQ